MMHVTSQSRGKRLLISTLLSLSLIFTFAFATVGTAYADSTTVNINWTLELDQSSYGAAVDEEIEAMLTFTNKTAGAVSQPDFWLKVDDTDYTANGTVKIEYQRGDNEWEDISYLLGEVTTNKQGIQNDTVLTLKITASAPDAYLITAGGKVGDTPIGNGVGAYLFVGAETNTGWELGFGEPGQTGVYTAADASTETEATLTFTNDEEGVLSQPHFLLNVNGKEYNSEDDTSGVLIEYLRGDGTYDDIVYLLGDNSEQYIVNDTELTLKVKAPIGAYRIEANGEEDDVKISEEDAQAYLFVGAGTSTDENWTITLGDNWVDKKYTAAKNTKVPARLTFNSDVATGYGVSNPHFWLTVNGSDYDPKGPVKIEYKDFDGNYVDIAEKLSDGTGETSRIWDNIVLDMRIWATTSGTYEITAGGKVEADDVLVSIGNDVKATFIVPSDSPYVPPSNPPEDNPPEDNPADDDEGTWEQQPDGSWQYVVDGEAATGWVEDNGKWYYLDEDGTMEANDWVKDDGKWYYLGANGAMKTDDWVKDGDTWYYLDASGAMKADDWVKDDGKWYYLDAKGAMKATAWVKDGNKWYYLDAKGAMKANAWQKDKNKWYYLDASGAMKASAWQKDKNIWYYLNASGAMVTGTQKIGAKTYKFAASGAWIA